MKLNHKNLHYLTYQVFPSEKANSLQTIRMLENFAKFDKKVCLYFPDRGKIKKTPDEINLFYDIKNKFDIKILKHRLPFNYFHIFNKFNFLLSSFVWSFFSSNKILKSVKSGDLLMTRTHWILLFLSRKENIIIYECHKYSKIEYLIFKIIKNRTKVILIFTNMLLKNKYYLSKTLEQNSLILESSFEPSQFLDYNFNKIKNRIVFVGNLLRFNKGRDIDFLVKAFSDTKLKDMELVIIGGPLKELKLYENFSNKNVTFLGPLSNKQAIAEMLKSDIGILINSDDEHSRLHTSPIKYFEYINAGLKIVAVDYPSHKNLPIQQNIYFYKPGDQESFKNAIFKASKSEFLYSKDIIKYSYENRVNKILEKIARLEGLEPPTL